MSIHKTRIYGSLFIVFLLLAVGILYFLMEEGELVKSLKADQVSDLERLSAVIEESYSNNNQAIAHKYVLAMLESPLIEYAGFVTSDGIGWGISASDKRVVAVEAGDKLVDDTLKSSGFKIMEIKDPEGGTLLHVSQPLDTSRYKNAKPGYARISYSKEALRARMKERLNRMQMTLSLIGILGLLIFLPLAGFLNTKEKKSHSLETRVAPPAQKPGFIKRFAGLFGRIEVWIVLSLIFIAMMRIAFPDAEGTTVLWFLDPLMSVIFLAVMWGNRRFQWKDRIRLSRPQAAVAFIAFSWLIGMLTELTLSKSPGSFGGLHEKTIPSFILAQGFYIPLAVLGFWVVRRYHLSFYELFFVAGMTSIYEAVVIGLPVLLSPMFIAAPIVIAYYFVLYSRLLSMGLLFIDEKLLWDHVERPISFKRKLGYGVLISIVCWTIFVAWGTAMAWVFNDYKAF